MVAVWEVASKDLIKVKVKFGLVLSSFDGLVRFKFKLFDRI